METVFLTVSPWGVFTVLKKDEFNQVSEVVSGQYDLETALKSAAAVLGPIGIELKKAP